MCEKSCFSSSFCSAGCSCCGALMLYMRVCTCCIIIAICCCPLGICWIAAPFVVRNCIMFVIYIIFADLSSDCAGI